MSKKISITLSDEVCSSLAYLCELYGLKQSACISLLIKADARRSFGEQAPLNSEN